MKMTTIWHNEGNESKILFFGRNKCDASQKLHEKLVRYGFDVTFVKSKKRNEKLPDDILWWNGDYIICFRSLFVLPENLLNKARISAINFHPGPPEYPGSGCINFALYDNSKQYGVTAHIMNAKVDSGDILEVRRFPINKLDDVSSVLSRTHEELYHMCSDFIHYLTIKGENLIIEKQKLFKNENWNGSARLMSELEKLKTIKTSVKKNELERIIRAAHLDGYPLKITLHGYNFYLRLTD